MPKNDKYENLEKYFKDGLSYDEIILFLQRFDGVEISKRNLHRKLRQRGLYRRRNHATANVVLCATKKELQGAGSNFGYRLMHQKLRSLNIYTDRETVRHCLSVLDREGVSARTNHRFRRRRYISKGPNFTWHLDGYDKLKPYGFAIHGAIDGWSRKVLWLYVGCSNNNPRIVSKLYLDCIKKLNLIPRMVRTDRGSENVVIAGCQRFFRRAHNDTNSGYDSFRYGASTRNQRIEAWWSIFRKNRSDWWISFFKDLCDSDAYDPSSPIQVECARFCFGGILQSELDETTTLWNNHYVRKSRNSECPPGRPNVLFYAPERSRGIDCKFDISRRDIEIAREFADELPIFCCSDSSLNIFLTVMAERNLQYPTNITSARSLFSIISNELTFHL